MTDRSAYVEQKSVMLAALKVAAKFEKWDSAASSGLVMSDGKVSIRTESPDCTLVQHIGDANGKDLRGIDPVKAAKWIGAAGSTRDPIHIVSTTDSFECAIGAHKYTSAPITFRGRAYEWSEKQITSYMLPAGAADIMLKNTVPFTYDAYRPNLHDKIEISVSHSGIKMVATDGYRMAIVEEGIYHKDLVKCVVWSHHIALIDGSKPWNVFVFEDSICISTNTTMMRCKIKNHVQYPDGERVRPREWIATVRIPAREFAMRTKPILAIDKDINIKLTGALKLSAKSSNNEKGETEFDIGPDDKTGPAEEINAMIDGIYLTQMANVFKCNGTIEMRYTAPTKPVAFKLHYGGSVDVEHVIMPMSQINNR